MIQQICCSVVKIEPLIIISKKKEKKTNKPKKSVVLVMMIILVTIMIRIRNDHRNKKRSYRHTS